MDERDVRFYGALNKLKSALSKEDENLVDSLVMEGGAPDVTFYGKDLSFDESYLDAIDKGLISIGKAIGEERRFIRSTGEVLPIEKIKRVSKESVIHLSRHSDLISRCEGDEIVPDKLYSAERLNDYATYENRFLCTLLVMIKDFLDDKYNLITKSSVFGSRLNLDKKASVQCRRLSVKLEIDYESEGQDCAEMLSKIEELRQRVDFLLRTPLMVEAAKEDRIRSLVKTNVLRMDKNFIDAVNLYEFLLLHESNHVRNEYERKAEVGKDYRSIFEPLLLIGFALRLAAGGEAARNELIELDKKLFEEKAAKLKMSKEGYMFLNERIDELNKENSRLSAIENEAKRSVEQNALNSKKLEDVERDKSELTTRFIECENNYIKERERLIEEHKKREAELNEQITSLKTSLGQANDRNTLLNARLNALSEVKSDDFSTCEGIDELEREFLALADLLGSRWDKIKAELKRRHRSELIGIVKKSKEVNKDER